MIKIRDRLRQKFDQLGVEGVKTNVRTTYSGEELEQAKAWLEEQAHDAHELMLREQNRISRDTADATWVQARAAERANKLATIALIVAAISLLVSIASFVFPLLKN